MYRMIRMQIRWVLFIGALAHRPSPFVSPFGALFVASSAFCVRRDAVLFNGGPCTRGPFVPGLRERDAI